MSAEAGPGGGWLWAGPRLNAEPERLALGKKKKSWSSPVRRQFSGQPQATACGVVLKVGNSRGLKHRDRNLAYLGTNEEESDSLGRYWIPGIFW